MPQAPQQQGDRGVLHYRLAVESFCLQVHWRWDGTRWDERDVVVVPGATVALRLVLGDVDPARITAALGLVPTRSFAREPGQRGRPGRDEGLWIHEVWPGGFQFAEEKVAELVGVLRSRPGFREVLALPGVTWAGLTVKLRSCLERTAGFALEPGLVADLAGLSLALDLACVAE
jgi:hypothetical protein